MYEGKLSNEDLKGSILDKLVPVRTDIITRPSVGEDCCAINFGDEACVLTTDPITGASEDVGKIAIHISANDIASSGSEVVAFLVTILAPLGTSPKEINKVMIQANSEANSIGAEIIGGHTEITSAVNKMIVSVTAVGRVKKDKLVNTNGAKPGDILVMTKYAALEGTGIICNDKAEELKDVLTEEEIKTGISMLDEISVLKEGEIGGAVGVSSMHDVTEGGIFGALWEVCEASNVGCEFKLENIEVKDITKKICEKYKIDPLKLISSGSMLMTVSKEKLEKLERMFVKESVSYSVLGNITSDNYIYAIDGNNKKIEIKSPETDELYKVI